MKEMDTPRLRHVEIFACVRAAVCFIGAIDRIEPGEVDGGSITYSYGSNRFKCLDWPNVSIDYNVQRCSCVQIH